MRRVLLIAALVALGVAGTAYAATAVTQVYVVKATVTPKKSGTKAKPKASGLTVSYTVKATPAGDRPAVVKTLVVKVAGVQVNTNDFPTCSTSKLNSTGPTSCPKNSLVGTGFFIVQGGLASSPTTNAPPCRLELSVYNGGGNSLSYYIYPSASHSNECTAAEGAKPTAFAVGLKEVKGTLVATINEPFSARHPNNQTTLDAATLQGTLSLPVKTIKLKSKKVKGKKVPGKTVGFGVTIACPPNHKRHISITFISESNASQTATANAACS
jgi:hypothetical protein